MKNAQKEPVPYAVVSPKEWESISGFFPPKRKKEMSEDWREKRFSFPFSCEIKEAGRSNEVIKSAVASATLSPYLRAVVTIFVAPNKISSTIFQTKENPLNINEVVGSLFLAHTGTYVSKSPRVIESFKEHQHTHMLNGTKIVSPVLNELSEHEPCEVFVLNIHHDYIRTFTNCKNSEILLAAIYYLKLNGI